MTKKKYAERGVLVKIDIFILTRPRKIRRTVTGCICDDLIEFISNVLQLTPLYYLDLSFSGVGTEGIKALACVIGSTRLIDVDKKQRVEQALSEAGFQLPVFVLRRAATIKHGGGVAVVTKFPTGQCFVEFSKFTGVVFQCRRVENLNFFDFFLGNDF